MDRDEKKAERFMNELDQLTKSRQNMSVQEAQEILDDFSRVLIFLNESTCYPSPYKPESLLPRKREKIEIALAIAMKHASDSERKNILYLTYSDLMDGFRPDNETEALNNKLLPNQEFVSKLGQTDINPK